MSNKILLIVLLIAQVLIIGFVIVINEGPAAAVDSAVERTVGTAIESIEETETAEASETEAIESVEKAESPEAAKKTEAKIIKIAESICEGLFICNRILTRCIMMMPFFAIAFAFR